eukprot:CAMPEP_0172356458 /NCGR_PEP_ID=MMETSP1060-20121228/820_1 /TAXON_ID=37318 /ORGANISM="Pseudo-nitzschia pungens, Strain cf. cingulata" /LENGTH=39 /DNA_ID= /DNA_START= /DNA_END= /DNA_ORIENTATION=
MIAPYIREPSTIKDQYDQRSIRMIASDQYNQSSIQSIDL